MILNREFSKCMREANILSEILYYEMKESPQVPLIVENIFYLVYFENK